MINEVSIFDLREQTAKQLHSAIDKRDTSMVSKSMGAEGYLDWWSIESGSKTYRVFTFVNLMWFCTCADFTYRQSACKHIGLVAPRLCGKCRVPVQNDFKCENCSLEDALYLKESSTKPAEKIAGIRIN